MPLMEEEEVGLFNSHAKVLKAARNEIQRFLEAERERLDGQELPLFIKQGCTIELGHMGLESLPEELIDVIKNEAERLALNQNKLTSLSGLSMRLPECTRLHYLVLRNNRLKEFPRVILSMPALKTLDLKGNQIDSLPEDLDRLTNLSVFDLRYNNVTKLPVCIGRMTSLSCIATRKNPIVFPPRQDWGESFEDEDDRKHLAKDRAETVKLKKLFQERMKSKKSFGEPESLATETNIDTPRPARRKASGRFPIKPSVTGVEPCSDPPPPSPLPPKFSPLQLPHLSTKQSPESRVGVIRPSITPTQPNNSSNERNRSSSESQMATSLKKKRMGLVSTVGSEQSKIEEKRLNRLSHLRGLSHGSALSNSMSAASNMYDSSASTSPVDGAFLRQRLAKRLSVLPEGRRKSHLDNPNLQFARSIQFSLYQTFRPIQNVIDSVKEDDDLISDLARSLWTTHASADELGRHIREMEDANEDEDDNGKKLGVIVHSSCIVTVRAYEQIVNLVRRDITTVVRLSSAKYIRTLMHMLYASLIEVRNACKKFGTNLDMSWKPRNAQPTNEPFYRREPANHQNISSGDEGSQLTQKPYMYQKQTPPNKVNEKQQAVSGISQFNPGHHFKPSIHAQKLLVDPPAEKIELVTTEELEEEKLFEYIVIKLHEACEFCSEGLQKFLLLLQEAKTQTERERENAENELGIYEASLDRCRLVIEVAADLQSRISRLKLRAPDTRNKPDFWQICTAFIHAFFMFANSLKDVLSLGVMTENIKLQISPVLKIVKKVARMIQKSQWGHLAVPPGQQPLRQDHNKSRSNSETKQLSQDQNHQQHKQQYPLLQQNHQQHPHSQYSYAARTLQYPQQPPMPPLPNPPPRQPNLTLQVKNNVPSPNIHEPLSTTSSHSQSGVSPGYITPLPATPMSAAIGPAASATIPNSSSYTNIPEATTPSQYRRGLRTGDASYFDNATLPSSSQQAMSYRSRSGSQKR